jgi:outer membrane protein OmpA-like peptidoglycan-associated protein
MKKLFKLFLMLFVFTSTFSTMAQQLPLETNYFQLSSRIGYDFPTYKNNTPYIDYKGGIDLGLSLDYYWDWFGLGFDFDYIKNKPQSTYPTTDLYESGPGAQITDFTLTEAKITRLFYGIGPNAQYRSKSGKFTAELNTRFGFASIKGGRTELSGATTTPVIYPLNFHAGYADSGVFTSKLQTRFTYYLSKNFGIHAGAYYMRHYGVKELSDSGVSAAYQPFVAGTDANGASINELDGAPVLREEPCDCDISSVGVFAGVTIKFNKKENKCPVCETDHVPHCCATCGCSVTVTAKDKFTGDILPNTDVVLTDLNGNIAKTGTTNSYGVVVFSEVVEDDYLIRGKLYNVALEESSISSDEFKNCKKDSAGIQKVIVYADENFILKGNVVECNTANGIQGVDVLLKDKLGAGQKNTLSDIDGNFIFHLKQASTYEVSGKKDGYYSNKVEYSTSSLDRNKTLFIDFEMCVDPCGKAIKLDNINFDLDKSEILPQAIPDLRRVIRLMQDNPNITVEMSSHTDSQGGDAYNQSLSQRRADATVNYIVSQGISRNRLIARGAGESELKNTKCANNVPCTDDEHRINRRTEFKVVCF